MVEAIPDPRQAPDKGADKKPKAKPLAHLIAGGYASRNNRMIDANSYPALEV
jgi:hypothetical protein